MNENGRVTFDIKMAQMIKMNISCKLIYCALEENLEEKAYNFSIKVKVFTKKINRLNLFVKKVSQFRLRK